MDKKIPSPLRSFALCNPLPSLFPLVPLVMFGKDLGPLKSLLAVLLDNGTSPKLQRVKSLFADSKWCPVLNSQEF